MRIELEDVSKRFGRVQALSDVSLSLPSGARVALIGPNGSGKSTLTRAMMGLVEHSGSILLDGETTREAGADLMRRIAYVPQIAPQFAAPVADLVRAVATLRELDTDAIRDVAARLDLDLPPLARRPFRNLSGGMKQKLLVALALAARPALLIMDEPTASLDARSRERFFELFEDLAGEATLVLCSHRFEEMRRLVDHVVLLEEGRVAWDGDVDAFLAARVENVIEVHAGSDPPRYWLEQQGFRPGLDGWWARRGTREENMKVLNHLTAELGARLREVIVRNLETIDLSRGRRG